TRLQILERTAFSSASLMGSSRAAVKRGAMLLHSAHVSTAEPRMGTLNATVAVARARAKSRERI
ncbi:hypothetical protein PENTCL1PPCAC_14929, partial [Pristionchus entomophagus]